MKILVVDDHALVRAGICQLIKLAYPDCGILEASTAEDGLMLAGREPPDLVLLDMCLPWGKGDKESLAHGLDMLDHLQKRPDSTPVIAISGEVTRELADLALRRGAIAMVPKSASPESLCAAIQTGLGELTPSSSLPLAAPVTPAALGVTRRMYDVLKLALEGHPPWKIALILDINATNVRRYLSRLYETFGVLNLNGLQAHFARTGQVLGIISESPAATPAMAAPSSAGRTPASASLAR